VAQTPKSRRLGVPVLVAIVLLVVFAALFLIVAVSYHPAPVGDATLSANSYVDKVDALLANADPSRAPDLLVQCQCVVCHVNGANNVAPSFTGLSGRAAQRHPPLTGPAYVYESIINPTAYVVEGYAAVMPENFADRIPDRDLGDIIAYLLKQ
jgi:hypothetical protein